MVPAVGAYFSSCGTCTSVLPANTSGKCFENCVGVDDGESDDDKGDGDYYDAEADLKF